MVLLDLPPLPPLEQYEWDCASDVAEEGIDREHIAEPVATATVVNGDCRVDDVGEVVIVNAKELLDLGSRTHQSLAKYT